MGLLTSGSWLAIKYGLYVSTVVGSIKGISYREINDIYNDLVIYSKKDIDIKAMEIAKCLNSEPGSYLSKIMNDIEKKIVNRKLENRKDDIISYIENNY